MNMSEFSSILPNNQQVLERDDKWCKLFAKYENSCDCEEDGYDVRDLIACGEVEDEELEDLFGTEDEALECSDDSDNFKENNNRELIVYGNKSKTLQDLERIYEPEFIQGLKMAFNKRCAELDGMNLTFWKRTKTHEGFNESNIKTPNFESSSKSFFRSSEEVIHSTKKLQPFKMPHPVNIDRDNFQFGNFPQHLAQASNFDTSQRFPFQINDLMNGSQKINIRIREMHYDLSVDGRDITGLFIPNCNSTYQNAMSTLGSSMINSTISNGENLQKPELQLPAIEYDVEKLRTEHQQKVIEKPELNISNDNLLNNSGGVTFDSINISDSSRDGYSSNGYKKNKRHAHKKRQKKQKSKQKKDRRGNDAKEIVHFDAVVPVSEKLELSYSDVVKNNLKPTKSSKPVNNSKQQIDQQKAQKAQTHHQIIDLDTSSENSCQVQKVARTKNEEPKKVIRAESQDNKKLNEKPEISSRQKGSENLQKKIEKAVEVKKTKVPSNDQRSKVMWDQNVQQKSKVDIQQKSKTEVTKSDVPSKDQKVQKSKVEVQQKSKVEVQQKSKKEVAKSDVPSNDQKVQQKSKVEVQPKSKTEAAKSVVSSVDQAKIIMEKVQQKSKENVKEIENKKVQPQKSSSATETKKDSKAKESSKDEHKNESKLQFGTNGVPFRNIGGFIVHYEENDSDSESTEDDTEFFRRIHEEIRQKKKL